jgi:Ala-tRNA(Pro) deacylase
MDKDELKFYLKKSGIDFIEHKHPAVYTVEEASRYEGDLDFMHCKSLFIKGKKSRNFYMVIMLADKRLDLKYLESGLHEKLTFASKEDLARILNIYPGAVGPFSLMNENASKVIVLIEKAIWDGDKVGFHPNDNTETLELSGEDFRKYISSLKNKIVII